MTHISETKRCACLYVYLQASILTYCAIGTVLDAGFIQFIVQRMETDMKYIPIK